MTNFVKTLLPKLKESCRLNKYHPRFIQRNEEGCTIAAHENLVFVNLSRGGTDTIT
jgi:hypothetical protein